MARFVFLLLFLLTSCRITNSDPDKVEIVTTDMENFWKAFDAAKPDFNPAVFDSLYLKKGTVGLDGFIDGRIKNSDNLSEVVREHKNYYNTIWRGTGDLTVMKKEIMDAMFKMKRLYPKAVFPSVYFIVGAMNSGATVSRHGLLIGTEMYGLMPETDRSELGDWHRSVVKSASELPHIVAHELVHYQQNYDGGSLLAASIKEGSADFIAELISGDHINRHVHDFANPKERELWEEFKGRMLQDDYNGWLYSSTEGRPNDLGYWMGYQITKSYYNKMPDKQKAIDDIMNIEDFEAFLEASGYPNSGL